MAKLTTGIRLFLGLIFFVFGLNGFLQFLPMPELGPAAMDYMGALMRTGFFFPVLKITEIVCGALLLSNILVPLALTILAPIILQIFLFHVTLAMDAAPMAVVILGCELFLARQYMSSFTGVLQMKAVPRS